MSLLASAVFSLLPAIWPFHPPQSVTHEYALPTWQLSMTKDTFADGLRCVVYQGKKSDLAVSYAGHGLVFHFSKRLNTLDAVYRLDGGAPKSWRDIYPKLIQTGGTLDGGSLDNPTGGLVTLPLSEVLGVHTVTIRPTPNAGPKTFTIDGYSDAVEAARVRGCQPEIAFTR